MALAVVRRLRRCGHEALLAGGCVRDMLMGRRAADFDVATSATPEEVAAIFRRVVMVGAKFGVAMVMVDRRRIEVATFRTDVSYSDGRRPDSVRFASSREDALRRDFTINGMFFDPIANEVVDYVGGQEDLKARVIRAIGQPEVRFSEDYLRMLRAARFAARFHFALDPATGQAIRDTAQKIRGISGERVREELEKMFSHPSAGEAVDLLHELGLLQAVLAPLFDRDDLWPTARRRIQLLASRKDDVLLMAALLADLTGEQIRAITRFWGASNLLRESLLWLSSHHNDWQQDQMALSDLKRLMAHRDWQRLVAMWKAQEIVHTRRYRQTASLRRRAASIDPKAVAPPPLLSGAELKGLGLSEGPRLGYVLRHLYAAQLNEAISTPQQALALARRLIDEKRA